MNDPATVHQTLVFERTLACPASTLFQAFADPASRSRWGRPSPTAVVIYDAADFRVGGRDISRCGAAEDPRFQVEAVYLDIVADRRIVYAETVGEGGTRFSAALYTVEIAPLGARAQLTLTAQIAAFAGPDVVEGVRMGFTAALENLALEVEGRA